MLSFLLVMVYLNSYFFLILDYLLLSYSSFLYRLTSVSLCCSWSRVISSSSPIETYSIYCLGLALIFFSSYLISVISSFFLIISTLSSSFFFSNTLLLSSFSSSCIFLLSCITFSCSIFIFYCIYCISTTSFFLVSRSSLSNFSLSFLSYWAICFISSTRLRLSSIFY